jgi:glycine dehydrogenase subunit 1
VRTYTQGMGLEISGDEPGTDLDALVGKCDAGTAAVVIQSPDFLGRLVMPSKLSSIAERVHLSGALLIVAANPISLGLFPPPGDLGADVVVGEGQALGNTMSFGGPYLGFFAFRRQHIRRSSGRIAGETTDKAGTRGFVFTLSTREQHIRREKATSNICTNQSLNALAAAVYLNALGPSGLRRVAELCWHKAHYAASCIAKVPGYRVEPGEFFNEFVVQCPRPVADVNHRLQERHGIIGGYDLGADFPQSRSRMLLCCTEMNTRADIDLLTSALTEAAHA